jgi:hypothetical protein
MIENDPTILDWLLNKLKNPKSWLLMIVGRKKVSSQSTEPIASAETKEPEQTSSEAPQPGSTPDIQAGLFQVEIALTIPPASSVDLKLETGPVAEDGVPPINIKSDPYWENIKVSIIPLSSVKEREEFSSPVPDSFRRFWAGRPRISIPLVTILVILSLLLYVFTRFAGLNRFPAFFFSDEAMQSLYAEQLIQNHFISASDKNIPVYVQVEGDRWSPMDTMYLQAVTVLLFGKSVLQTRATSIFIGFLGVIAVALTLKLIFKQKYWWVAILFLTLLPAWFLHSRTAFETVMTTAFYAIFLLFYLLYRYRTTKFIFGAIFFGAVTFYSYSNGQALMGITALGLLISDWKFHKKNWRIILWSLPLLIFLLIPLVIFGVKVPNGVAIHLRAIDSFWYQHISTSAKIQIFLKNYLIGLSPQYWFIANSRDLIRHRMIGYGHIPLWSLPLVIIGLILTFKNFRESSYRAITIALLAAPVGGSMLEISIARTLAFIIPVTILAILGLEWLFSWAERKIKPSFVATGVFILFSLVSLRTLNDAVINGPLWTDIYDLYGLQFGAVQIYQDVLPQYIKDPNTRRITVSAAWANAGDRFVEFFLKPQEYQNRVFVDGIGTYLLRKQDLSPQDLFVWTPGEYKEALKSGKFKFITVEKVIPYPNGEPGFYVVRMQYADNIDEILAAEKAARSQPIEGDIEIDGQNVHVTYSLIDGGELKNIFDGDPYTLMRALEANPMVVQMEFPDARQLTGLDLTTTTMDDFTVKISAYDDKGNPPVVYEQNFINLPTDPTTNFDFNNGPANIKKLVVEITYHTLQDPTHIHIREIKLR